MQQKDLREQVIREAEYFVENKSTVRATAKEFGLAKSTVYRHLTFFISSYDPVLAEEVREVLNVNRNERALRGGASTKKKYLLLRWGKSKRGAQ